MEIKKITLVIMVFFLSCEKQQIPAISSIDFNADSKLLCVGSLDGQAHVVFVDSGQIYHTFTIGDSNVMSVSFWDESTIVMGTRPFRAYFGSLMTRSLKPSVLIGEPPIAFNRNLGIITSVSTNEISISKIRKDYRDSIAYYCD